MKRYTRSSDAFRRSSLENTLKLLYAHGSDRTREVETALSSSPLPNPPEHASPNNEDWLRISVEPEAVEDILQVLIDVEAASIDESGHATTQTNEAASLVDLWDSYLELRNSNREA